MKLPPLISRESFIEFMTSFRWFFVLALISLGILLTPFLIKWGLYTAVTLALFVTVTLQFLAATILPLDIYEKYPLEYAIVGAFILGLAFEYTGVFKMHGLTIMTLSVMGQQTFMPTEILLAIIIVAMLIVKSIKR
jgi:hypothetical protein